MVIILATATGREKKGPPFSVLVRNEKRRKGKKTRDTNILGDE